MDIKKLILEELTKTDEKSIGIMIRKEIKDAFGKDLEKKVRDIITKEIKGKPFEKQILKISVVKDIINHFLRYH